MKTIRLFLIMLAGICLLTTCEKEDEFFSEDLTAENLKCTDHHGYHHGLNQERWVTMRSTGLKVHYRIIGKGPVDVVFIPGWTNPLTAYTKQFDYFKNKARCIYIDLPGHGLSDAPENIEYTMELMADAIYAVIKKEGVHRFIGVGFSWGHSPLTQFEIKHPGLIRKLILLDIGIITWPPMSQSNRENTYNAYLNLTPVMKSGALASLIPPATAPEYLLEWGQYFLDFPNWLLANMYYHYLTEEVCQPYPWNIPIMVIYRAMDDTKKAKTELFFPGCDIHIIGGDQHVVQWAYHDTVNPLLKEFIDFRYRHGKKH